MTVRRARRTDHPALVDALGQPEFFTDRLARQRNGHGELIVAWSPDATVAGAVYLWLEQAEEPELRELLPRVPLLTHLEVLAAQRNRGIGTALVAGTEASAANRGHDRIALAVERDNAAAMRLYERLGYRFWDHGPVICTAKDVTDDGVVLREEICRIMVKPLIPAPGSRAENLAANSGAGR